MRNLQSCEIPAGTDYGKEMTSISPQSKAGRCARPKRSTAHVNDRIQTDRQDNFTENRG